MRIDARRGDYVGWIVWHVPRCQVLRHVVWVDDSTHQWAQYLVDQFGRLTPQFGPNGPEPVRKVFQAKRIKIMVDRRLVLIDPIDDPDAEKDDQEVDQLKLGGTQLEVAGVK